jgi:predicted DNA-binding protein (UPF0251 family)/predicted Fe-Mo cluster-binding NifX family protein
VPKLSRPLGERILVRALPPRLIKPAGVPAKGLPLLVLRADEAEALRLADLEGLYHEAAARSMGVSRQTFGRIVGSARRKVADALLNGKALRVDEGAATIRDEGEKMMKIAVPAVGGLVDEHFGHCREFLVFSRGLGGILSQEPTIDSAEGCGCKSGVAAELARAGVTHLVAGNMGEGAARVLASHGIAVIRGASGDARAAAEAFAAGKLADSGSLCAGHSSEPGRECGN